MANEQEIYTNVLTQLEALKRDLESITDRSNELNDSSKDRDIASNNERDQTTRTSTVDLSQDVDTQERLRANSVSYDNAKAHQELESTKRDRSEHDQDVEAKNRLQRQLDARGLDVIEADRRAVDQAIKLQDQLNQTYATTVAQMFSNMVTINNQQLQNMVADSEKNKSGDRFSDYQNRQQVWKHNDHTLMDEHPSTGGPESGQNAPDKTC